MARGGEDVRVNRADVDRLSSAVEALNRRDIEPFVGLMAQDMVWRGRPHGWPWRRFTPT